MDVKIRKGTAEKPKLEIDHHVNEWVIVICNAWGVVSKIIPTAKYESDTRLETTFGFIVDSKTDKPRMVDMWDVLEDINLRIEFLQKTKQSIYVGKVFNTVFQSDIVMLNKGKTIGQK
jgi:hypothetical protein